MNPRRRTLAIQAHSLHCRGLTHRQIGERMNRSPSTVGGYLKDFHDHRDEIIQSLAADQLAHSLAGLATEDPDLHQQHINAARELRLQTDTLDRVVDRRQRRDRRVQEEEIHDALRNIEAYGDLALALGEHSPWNDPHTITHFIETGELLEEPDPPDSAPAVSPQAPSDAPGQIPLQTEHRPAGIAPATPEFEHNRSKPIKTDRVPAASSANQANSAMWRRESAKQHRTTAAANLGP